MTANEKDQTQFLAGLRNIGGEVIDGLAKIGITLVHKNVDWSPWSPGRPIPTTALQISFEPDGFPPTRYKFTREQIVDSWESLEANVRILTRRIVKNYADLKAASGKHGR